MNQSQVACFLVASGTAAPSADNTQPWRFELDGSALSLRFDSARMHNTSFPFDHPATMITMGAVIENLDQAAALLQLPCELKPIIPTSPPYEFLKLTLSDSNLPHAPENAPLFARHTNRLTYRTNPIGSELRATLCSESEEDARILFIESKTDMQKIASMVRLASQIRFQTREIHEWFSSSLRFTRSEVARGDGLDVATFDLPPGGHIFMRWLMSDWRNMALLNRIGGYRMMAGIEAASITKAGAIIAILGSETLSGALHAGRLMERIWIKLNQSGLAVQPYYVVSDQLTRLTKGQVPHKLCHHVERLQDEVSSTLSLPGNARLHMLLRVGLPLHAPSRSLRLPLEFHLPHSL